MGNNLKKFLTFLVVLVVVFTFGLLIARLLRDEETISLRATNNYYNVNEQVVFGYDVKNINKSSKITTHSTNENVVKKLDNGVFTAVNGGNAQIVVTHVNPRGKTTEFVKDVFVGNGSEANPFYVRNETELLNIGTGATPEDIALKLTKHYIQTVNITLSNAFVPFQGVLTGSYRGMLIDDNTSLSKTGFTRISNYNISTAEGKSANYSSMFESIGTTGKFGYLTFDKVNILGSFENASVVCRDNHGKIDFVSVYGNIETTKSNGIAAAIAIENSYNKAENKAEILRCSNRAQITTAGNQVAGIVFRNKASVTFCINGGEEANNGKLTAKNGTDVIAGGIVGINAYGFGNDLKNAINSVVDNKDDIVNTELTHRPIVKDSYNTSDFGIIPIGNSFVGGIVGQEIQGHNKILNRYEQIYDNLTMGNYYIKYEGGAFNSGVGNLEYTKESVINIYDPNAAFVAIGISVDELLNGIKTILPSGEEDRASLISFNQDGSRKTWTDENIYVFYKLNGEAQLPIQRTTSSFFNKLSFSLPNTIFTGGTISNISEFLRTNFTDLSASGQPREFKIDGWIDFSESTNSSDFDTYFTTKGNENKAASFVLKANFVKGADGISPLLDENGDIVYYGFKNLTPVFKNDAKFAGIFGVIQNATLENISFVDCFVSSTEADDTGKVNTESMGLVAGKAINSTFNNLKFRASSPEGGCAVDIGSTVQNGGGVVGTAENAKFNNLKGLLNVGGIGVNETSGIGGIVGKSTAGVFNRNKLQVAIESSGLVGGLVGISSSDTMTVNEVTGNVVGNSTGGIAGTINGGSFSHIKTSIEIGGTSDIAGFSVTMQDAQATNLYLDTKFKAAMTRSGLVSELKSNGEIINAVFINNFIGAAGTNYAKTKNVAGQRWNGDKISQGQDNRAAGSGYIRNSFFVNKIDGAINNNKAATIFYASQTFIGTQNGSFDPTKVVEFGWTIPMVITYHGIYGAGLIKEDGRVNVEKDGKNAPLTTFGFDATWNMSGFPVLNIWG